MMQPILRPPPIMDHPTRPLPTRRPRRRPIADNRPRLIAAVVTALVGCSAALLLLATSAGEFRAPAGFRPAIFTEANADQKNAVRRFITERQNEDIAEEYRWKVTPIDDWHRVVFKYRTADGYRRHDVFDVDRGKVTQFLPGLGWHFDPD